MDIRLMRREHSPSKCPESFGKPEESTGLPSENSPHVTLPKVEAERALSMAWIPDDLLAKTQRVWSKTYGRPVGEEEAVEILTNVKHLARALMKAKRGGDGG